MAEVHARQTPQGMLVKILARLANRMKVVVVASHRDSWDAIV
jgi:hypothetical protein